MPLNLTSNIQLPAGARLILGRFHFDDETEMLTIPVELRTNNTVDSPICSTALVISNTQSTRIERQTAPAAGLRIDDVSRYFLITLRDTPTGYSDAKQAERAANNTKAARRAALEAHLLSAGHIDPVSLAAT